MGRFMIKAQALSRRNHGFHKREKIRGTAAGDRRDDVDMGLRGEPTGGSHHAHNRFNAPALLIGDFITGE